MSKFKNIMRLIAVLICNMLIAPYTILWSAFRLKKQSMEGYIAVKKDIELVEELVDDRQLSNEQLARICFNCRKHFYSICYRGISRYVNWVKWMTVGIKNYDRSFNALDETIDEFVLSELG